MSDVSTSVSWLPKRRPASQARLRLFCFPYAGGNASLFHTWQTGLPDVIDVCPIQLPGRAGRLGEAPFTRLSPLIRTLSCVLQPYMDLPFAFFGHSMGALISFELARFLYQQDGLSPRYLFISAHGAPQIQDHAAAIYHLPDEQFLEEVRLLQGTPEGVLQNAELMQLLLPTLRADFELCGTYTYTDGEPLDCPISAFGGTLDPMVKRENLAAWHVLTRSAFQLRMVPGNHFFLHSAQRFLLKAIAQDLSHLLIALEREKSCNHQLL